MFDPNQFDKSKFSTKPYVKKVPKPWGFEIHFVPDGLSYMGKILHIKAGKRLSLQTHDQKQETYWLLNGECDLVLENETGELETVSMQKGVGYTTQIGQRHRHQAVTDCDIMEASTGELGTTYRLEDDYKRPDETEDLRKNPNRGWSE
jgi:mannose-6-phosphate isomerase-like protein (cupin superfamily)